MDIVNFFIQDMIEPISRSTGKVPRSNCEKIIRF